MMILTLRMRKLSSNLKLDMMIDELEENLTRRGKWNGRYQIIYAFKLILNVVSCEMLCT
jgi:hypothetical protein